MKILFVVALVIQENVNFLQFNPKKVLFRFMLLTNFLQELDFIILIFKIKTLQKQVKKLLLWPDKLNFYKSVVRHMKHGIMIFTLKSIAVLELLLMRLVMLWVPPIGMFFLLESWMVLKSILQKRDENLNSINGIVSLLWNKIEIILFLGVFLWLLACEILNVEWTFAPN